MTAPDLTTEQWHEYGRIMKAAFLEFGAVDLAAAVDFDHADGFSAPYDVVKRNWPVWHRAVMIAGLAFGFPWVCFDCFVDCGSTDEVYPDGCPHAQEAMAL